MIVFSLLVAFNISATNRDHAQLIAKGRFREDFYCSINVIPNHIPTLHGRADDIPLLVRPFFNHIKLKSDKQIRGISNPALEALVRYTWPGVWAYRAPASGIKSNAIIFPA